MARPMWTGAISFGLVSIPVKLYSGVSAKSVSFNQIDRETNSRIRQKKFAGDDGREVSNDDIVKGYKLPSGDFVIIEPEELEALEARENRAIEIESFIDQDEIDPIYFNKPYFLAPDVTTLKPYALLMQALDESGKVGVARFVMRGKQHLAAIRVLDGMLVLNTMHYADEVNDLSTLESFEALGEVDVKDAELAMAQQLIDSLTEEFDAEVYRDTYRESVLEMIERKADGQEAVPAAAEQDEEAVVIDIMAALEASVAATKKDMAEIKAAPAKKKKAAAKKKSAAKKKAPAKKKTTAKKKATAKRKSA